MNMTTVAQQFNEEGFVILPGLYTPEELENMETHLRNHVERVVPTLGPGDVYYEDSPSKSLKSVFRLEAHSEYFRQLMEDPRLLQVVRAIFPDREVRAEGVSFFGKPAREGSVTPPHQDNGFHHWIPPDVLTATVALDESTPENGVLTCQKGSHRLGVLPHRPSGILGFSQTLAQTLDPADYPEVQLCMKPGDVALHHFNTVHYSAANRTDRSRRQIGIVFRSTSARQDPEKVKQYQAALNQLHEEKVSSPGM